MFFLVCVFCFFLLISSLMSLLVLILSGSFSVFCFFLASFFLLSFCAPLFFTASSPPTLGSTRRLFSVSSLDGATCGKLPTSLSGTGRKQVFAPNRAISITTISVWFMAGVPNTPRAVIRRYRRRNRFIKILQTRRVNFLRDYFIIVNSFVFYSPEEYLEV